MDHIEKWGTSVDEAVELALSDLKVSRDEVSIQVLEEPSRGFFGIGAKLALVRVEKIKKEPEKVEPAPEVKAVKEVKKETKREEKKDKPKKDNSSGGKKKKKQQPINIALDDVDVASLTPVEEHEALDFLKDVSEKMGLSLQFSARTGKDLVYIEMSGKDSRTIIGKRGQTLDAVQYLTSLVVNKDRSNYMKVVLDAENYREKRQRTLEQLANRLAAKVVKTGKRVRLEPMNPYERKVIHSTLQQNSRITTRSEGEEPYRRVIIELKK